MSDSSADDNQDRHEGGDIESDVPSSSVDLIVDEDEHDDETIVVPLPEVREVARREVMQAMAWQGPLPPPEHYAQFKTTDPDLAIAIKERFQSKTALEVRITEHGISADNRELDLKEREQKLREKESDHDMKKSDRTMKFAFWFLPLLVAAAIFVLLVGPSGAGTIAVALALLAPLTLLLAIVLLRGRMSQAESDVYRGTLPQIANGGRRPGSAADADDQDVTS